MAIGDFSHHDFGLLPIDVEEMFPDHFDVLHLTPDCRLSSASEEADGAEETAIARNAATAASESNDDDVGSLRDGANDDDVGSLRDGGVSQQEPEKSNSDLNDERNPGDDEGDDADEPTTEAGLSPSLAATTLSLAGSRAALGDIANLGDLDAFEAFANVFSNLDIVRLVNGIDFETSDDEDEGSAAPPALSRSTALTAARPPLPRLRRLGAFLVESDCDEDGDNDGADGDDDEGDEDLWGSAGWQRRVRRRPEPEAA